MGKPTEAQRLLRVLIERHGVTQESIAERVDMDPSQLSRYLSGSRIPSLLVAHRFLVAYEIPMRAWLDPPQRGEKKRRRPSSQIAA